MDNPDLSIIDNSTLNGMENVGKIFKNKEDVENFVMEAMDMCESLRRAEEYAKPLFGTDLNQIMKESFQLFFQSYEEKMRAKEHTIFPEKHNHVTLSGSIQNVQNGAEMTMTYNSAIQASKEIDIASEFDYSKESIEIASQLASVDENFAPEVGETMETFLLEALKTNPVLLSVKEKLERLLNEGLIDILTESFKLFALYQSRKITIATQKESCAQEAGDQDNKQFGYEVPNNSEISDNPEQSPKILPGISHENQQSELPFCHTNVMVNKTAGNKNDATMTNETADTQSVKQASRPEEWSLLQAITTLLSEDEERQKQITRCSVIVSPKPLLMGLLKDQEGIIQDKNNCNENNHSAGLETTINSTNVENNIETFIPSSANQGEEANPVEINDEKPLKCRHEGCSFTSSSTPCIEYHLCCSQSGNKRFLRPRKSGGKTQKTKADKQPQSKTKPNNNHWKKTYNCRHVGCSFSFSKAMGLEKHVKIHSGITAFPCPYLGCGKAFSRQTDLKFHCRTHTGERPYKCGFRGCGVTFATRSSFASHKRNFSHGPPKAPGRSGKKRVNKN